MVWFNSKYDLQYYNPILGFPCYCEFLVEPNDLTMQAVINAPTTGVAAAIEVYSADGNTNYGTFTNYFTITYGINQNGNTYFQIQLNTFAPPMCEHECWVLHVVLSIGGVEVFNKWTERFCNVACCGTVGKITIINDDGTTTVQTFDPTAAVAECGIPIVRLETWNDCYDKFTGEFYGAGFKKITNIRGRFIRKPRNIEKTIALNCKVQKVKSARLFQIEAWDYYPEWKMDELELQLQAQHILIDGKEYSYTGGTPFSKPDICQNIYLLNTEVQECVNWQTFGCSPCVVSNTKYFRLSNSYAFYSENKEEIGSSAEDVADYFRAQSGTTNVELIPVTTDCQYTNVVKVESNGYIPAYVYSDGVLPMNKVYPVDNVDDICAGAPTFCIPPEIGTITLTTPTCEQPEIGTITLTRLTPVPRNNSFEVTITEAGNAFTDSRLAGYTVMLISTDGQAYNSAYWTKDLESDTLTSKNYPSGDPILTFTVGQLVTVILQ